MKPAGSLVTAFLFPCLLIGLLVVSFLISVPAHAVYKCSTSGSVMYTDRPCEGRSLELSSAPEPSLSTSSAPDSRNEDALRREKAEVARLQKIREQRERQDQQIRDLSARGAAARERKCRSLSLQLRWREEDLRIASLTEERKARVRARRAAEKFAMECQ